MASGISGNTLWILGICGIFFVIDVIMGILIFIEYGKLQQCTGKQSLFCPFFTCSSLLDENGNKIGNPNLNIGFSKCSSFMWRKIDPNGDDDDFNNIECNLPPGNDQVGGPIG